MDGLAATRTAALLGFVMGAGFPSLGAMAPIRPGVVDSGVVDLGVVDLGRLAGQQGNEELERLRAMLYRSGADGREAREQAVERLLAMPTATAHRILQDELLKPRDPDGLRRTILTSLARHAFVAPERLFGGATESVRVQIVHGYLVALLPLWSPGADGEAVPAARQALQRLPLRDLESAARSLLASASTEQRHATLLALSDLQQSSLAPLLAEQLAAPDEQLRATATAALQRLLYPPEPLRTPEQFQAFWRVHGELRYLDFTELAARRALAAPDNLENVVRQIRRESDRDLVRAMVERSPGIDWATVQARTVVDDAETRNACLEVIRRSLQAGLPAEDSVTARQTFARALLQRYRQLPTTDRRAAALLLEVVAYLTKNDEAELASEVVGQLLAQLDSDDTEVQFAVLRGLRRFPSVDTRSKLVQFGRSMSEVEARRAQLVAVLATLGARGAPRWQAPAPNDVDKAGWLELVGTCLRASKSPEVREQALQLAQLLDPKEQRVPEVFDLLVGLVRDITVDARLRQATLVQLQAWRVDGLRADEWVRAMQGLLADPAVEIRRKAADSLALMTGSTDSRRAEWITASIPFLRNQLEVEGDVAALQDLVDCLQQFGREPQMAEKAIGALMFVLRDLNPPVPAEQQVRLDSLLQALTTIGADPVAAGQWVPACEPLLLHRKRQSLRLVLQNHAAVELASAVNSPDPILSRRARRAMQLLVETALLKPGRENWSDSEDLQREVRDVRVAFAALDGIEDSGLKDSAAQRLLRLEVDLAAGRFQEVVQRATALLAPPVASGPARPPFQPEEQLQVRTLAAEAQLGLNRPELALRLLDETGEGGGLRVDLLSRIGRALVATDAGAAFPVFERVLKVTAPEDPAYRGRLLDVLRTRLLVEPGAREAVLKQAETCAPLFQAADCPAELREAFAQLRASRG